ncbi:MAG TPA: hypothetical protein VIY56_02450 [Vicinamibacterales bacterium]
MLPAATMFTGGLEPTSRLSVPPVVTTVSTAAVLVEAVTCALARWLTTTS